MFAAGQPSDRFLALHRPGAPLLMPNPWDAGSARLLASLGFEALATTSSGYAATLGRRDGGGASVSVGGAFAFAALAAAAEAARELREQWTAGYLERAATGVAAARAAFQG